jgi:DNA-3-methyladenine glycosylase
MKLLRSFYLQSAIKIAPEFLGKYLVYNSPKGKVSGKIVDVEAYPAFTDNVSHGNKRTKRTEVMYKQGGYIYVYLIYGIHRQFAVVVNKVDIPEVVFIRAVIPLEGIDIMKINFNKSVKNDIELTKSPGNLCKSFGIDLSLYGTDLTSNLIYIEDRGDVINPQSIISDRRVGINTSLQGSQHKLRFCISENSNKR